MNNPRTKLISAVLMLTLSIVMLAGASLAWFTVSTAPEVTGLQATMSTDLAVLISKDGEDFTQSVTTATPQLGDKPVKDSTSIDNLAFYGPLRPVSTVDGIHWYRAAYYASTGGLQPVDYFVPVPETSANVVLWEQDKNGEYTQPIPSGTNAYITAENESYYMYADIWLKTEEAGGVDVTLSAPDLELNNLQDWETGNVSQNDEVLYAFSQEHSNKYGTYVLDSFRTFENAEGETVVESADTGLSTTMRVGFLLFEEDENGEEVPGTFTIYEPNADQRSDYISKPKYDGDEENPPYIAEYGSNSFEAPEPDYASNYQPGSYIPTYPIGTEGDKPATVRIPDDRLIVQTGSEWKENASEAYPNLTSAHVESFGKFVKNNAELYLKNGFQAELSACEQGLASSTIIVHLEQDEPKKVRVFFWIEGQDPDCWNDVAGGRVKINLEFAAQSQTGE